MSLHHCLPGDFTQKRGQGSVSFFIIRLYMTPCTLITRAFGAVCGLNIAGGMRTDGNVGQRQRQVFSVNGKEGV